MQDNKCIRCKKSYPGEFFLSFKERGICKTCKFCREKQKQRKKLETEIIDEQIQNDHDVRTCNRCFQTYDRDQFISKVNGNETKKCLKCRELITSTTRCEHGKTKSYCSLCSPLHHFVYSHCRRLSSYIKGEYSERYDEMLCCTIRQFKEHIESKLTNNMTLDNYGEYWWIDHIKPLFEIQDGEYLAFDEIKDRMHFSNTQPLPKIENILKSNKTSDQ